MRVWRRTAQREVGRQLRVDLRVSGPAWGRGRRAGARAVVVSLVAAMVAAGASLVTVAPAMAAGGTLLVSEGFTGTSVLDPRFVPLASACLTAAATGSTPPAGASSLSDCLNTVGTPVGSPGWLQLTDATLVAGSGETGGVLFNQALPSSQGMQVTFDQAQYGGTGADGIGFFLANGAYNLTTAGAFGGSLGYARSLSGTVLPGLVGGFVGVGLDAYGNYEIDPNAAAAGCTDTASPTRLPNSVALRGAGALDSSGAWTHGYCMLQYQQLTPSLRTGTANPAKVRITVGPAAPGGSVTVTVELSFDGGTTYSTYLTQTVPNAPATLKFGFSGSTGGLTDVHLVRNLTVSTVNPLGEISLVKQEDLSSPNYRSIYQVGDVIPYQFVVTNPDTTSALDQVVVTDPALDSGSLSCPSTTLAPAGQPGSTMTCSGTHTVTATDVVPSTSPVPFPNTASVSGQVATTGTPVSATASHSVQVDVPPAPGLSLTKTVSPVTVHAVGDQVGYVFHVVNTGNVTLSGVAVDDSSFSGTGTLGAISCPGTSLVPAASMDCTAGYVVTQADVDAGSVVNTATVSGLPPGSSTPVDSPPSTVTVTVDVPPAPGLSLTKTVSPVTVHAVGDQVGYVFHVVNTGNVTLSGVAVDDSSFSGTGTLGAISCPGTSLVPAASMDCTASYTVTAADVAAGKVTNTATVTGIPPGAEVAIPPSAPSTVTVASAAVVDTGSPVGTTHSRWAWLGLMLLVLAGAGGMLLGRSRRGSGWAGPRG